MRRDGADTDLETFLRLYFVRAAATNIRIQKALCAALLATLTSTDITGAIIDCPDRPTPNFQNRTDHPVPFRRIEITR